jgi:hypothetical protein
MCGQTRRKSSILEEVFDTGEEGGLQTLAMREGRRTDYVLVWQL